MPFSTLFTFIFTTLLSATPSSPSTNPNLLSSPSPLQHPLTSPNIIKTSHLTTIATPFRLFAHDRYLGFQDLPNTDSWSSPQLRFLKPSDETQDAPKFTLSNSTLITNDTTTNMSYKVALDPGVVSTPFHLIYIPLETEEDEWSVHFELGPDRGGKPALMAAADSQSFPC